MKRFLVPVVMILSLFALIGGTLNHFLDDSGQSKTSPKRSILAPMQDRTTIDFKNVTVTTGPKVPVWGNIRQTTQPKVDSKIESTSFHNNKVATATQTKQKKAEAKKKKKKTAKKKKKTDVKTAKKSQTEEPVAITSAQTPQTQILFPADLNPKKKNDKPTTSDDWYLAITEPESRDKLDEFIKLHQAGQVNDTVFFEVSEKLLSAESNNLNRFGLLALGSFMSYKSFELTAQHISQQEDGNLRAMALGNLDVYQSVNSLGLLRSLLGSTSDSARYYSSYLIGGSAQLHLRPAVSASPTNPINPPVNPPRRGGRDGSSTVLVQNYQSLLPILESVMTSDPNADVRQAALRSREIIRSLSPSPFVAGF